MTADDPCLTVNDRRRISRDEGVNGSGRSSATSATSGGGRRPIIDAERGFSAAEPPFDWNYLLDWKPQYRPLADVFAEIARLPDENAPSRGRPAKICPTQIVPQTKTLSAPPSAFAPSRNAPPPIITNVPPRAFQPGRPGGGSMSSTGSSTASGRHHRTAVAPTCPAAPTSPFGRTSATSSGQSRTSGTSGPLWHPGGPRQDPTLQNSYSGNRGKPSGNRHQRRVSDDHEFEI